MSARRLQVSSDRTIERKRQEIRAKDEATSEEQVNRIMRAEMTWMDWLRHEYVKYWYVLGAVALDVFLGLGLVDAVGIIAVILLLVALMAAEVYGYFWIWPRSYPNDE
jgi:hypothetical protein